jgi:hypothetical protein
MGTEILEPEDRLYCQAVEVLEYCQGGGGHFTERLDIVSTGESPGDRPLEERDPFLGRDRLQQGQHPFLFHRFNYNERVRGTDQSAKIVHTG